MKIKTGIIFGGISREREISFAGGRTVYDNLNKSIFEPVPVFLDSFGNFILLEWEYIYKGSIRDFYPPTAFIPPSKGEFQVYAESLQPLKPEKQADMIQQIGKPLAVDELKELFDFAFLCLHGTYGEDGRIQGLLEFLQIPFSGSGILPSAIGINKLIQKGLMRKSGFNSPDFVAVRRKEWLDQKVDRKALCENVATKVGCPCVVKSVHQGSSIGISIVSERAELAEAINKGLFIREIDAKEWSGMGDEQKNMFVRQLADIREGIGVPVRVGWGNEVSQIIYHPDELLSFVNAHFANNEVALRLEAIDSESDVIIEGFIEGKEFSCIVIEDEQGCPVALPPTEIRKGKELFDYRSKYLPGLSRKITPINLPDEQIGQIRKECERLFDELNFDVYARIDGFIKDDGTIYLNDPNTTSGMMPSSFFFHQAAEIGLNPSQFLTYLIRTSLVQRTKDIKHIGLYDKLLWKLDQLIEKDQSALDQKIKIAVILGGFSSERHISVESGRNIYEKLASSVKYEPIPVFLTGDETKHLLYQIPINMLLKDNADDIKEKIDHYHRHPVIDEIIQECSDITQKYSSAGSLAEPRLLSYNELATLVDGVFIALHGRPGEDGAVQAELDSIRLAYNGSSVESSSLTIDKYRTNELLKENGLLVAEHMLVSEDDWNQNREAVLTKINDRIGMPFIAKPVDDGCSSAVRKIKTVEELEAFADLIFRKTEEFDIDKAAMLHIKPKEEFPRKRVFLIEELVTKKDAAHFLEITGGMLTKFDASGNVNYEVFEASEALSEGEVLSLEEKFLAGQGQNITPARYAPDAKERQRISDEVKKQLQTAAELLKINGYARIDAFVRIYDDGKVEVIFIEVNSLPGMTPATCIFHQAAIDGYKPYDFIDKIMDFSFKKRDIMGKLVNK